MVGEREAKSKAQFECGVEEVRDMQLHFSVLW